MGEVETAIENGVPVNGVCMYPILDIQGWVDNRPCPVGLLSSPDEEGRRSIYEPLAREIRAFQSRPTPAKVREPLPIRRARTG